MAIVQASAADNGDGTSGVVSNTYPGAATSGNFRFKIVCPQGDVNCSSIVESPGAVGMVKQNDVTDTNDPYFVGQNKLQVWAPTTFGATTSALTTLASNTPTNEFWFEDDEIDPAVGYLGGTIKDNSAGANPLTTDAVTAGGDVVVYEVTSSGGGSSLGFTNGGGPSTAVSGSGITSGHHGNTTDGDDMYVQRRVVLGGGSLTATIGNPGAAACNTALFFFRKKAAGPAGSSDDDQTIEG